MTSNTEVSLDDLIEAATRNGGFIIHKDGNCFFTNMDFVRRLLKEFTTPQPATVQDGKAIGYVVSIGGDYQFFRDYDTALRERRQYEQSVAPDFEQMLPQPVFTHPPITLTRENE